LVNAGEGVEGRRAEKRTTNTKAEEKTKHTKKLKTGPGISTKKEKRGNIATQKCGNNLGGQKGELGRKKKG